MAKNDYIKITNPDKIIFPKDSIKKIDIIKYYINIAEFMLPFIKNRLLAVVRCHNGIKGECFYKKHPTLEKDMVKCLNVDNNEYFYIDDKTSLVYQAQMGTIEFHIWGSSIKCLDKPNFMVFDLDPDEKMPIKELQEAVLKVKSILDELNLKSFLKTSGGKGYHIVVPFNKVKNWDTFLEFAKNISILASNKWPDIFTTNIRKEKRSNKIFIDYFRNRKGSTCVCPYSVRIREHATISMPISWKDLFLISPNSVNIKNYKDYLNNSWKDFFNVKQNLI